MTKRNPEAAPLLPPMPAVRRRYVSTVLMWAIGAILLTVLCYPGLLIARGLVMAAYLKQAEQALSEGNLASATSNYDSAMGWSGENETPYQERWNIARQTGDIESALAAYDAAVAEHASASLPYCYRGQAYRQLGQKDAALADYQRCIDYGPNAAWRVLAPSAIKTLQRQP